MATLILDDDRLRLELTRSEKVAGLHGDIEVPLGAVREVAVEPDALAAVHGLRAPGLAIPMRTRIGTWRGRGRRSFVVARHGIPAVRVTLSGARYDELIVSTAQAGRVAAEVRERLGR